MKTLLVTIANNAYYNQARQVLVSAKINGGWKGDLMVISDDMDKENTRSFEKEGVLVNHKPLVHNEEEWFSHLPKDTHLPPIMTLKYYLFTKEFQEWDRIVYLDSDIIVRGKLDKLIQIDRQFSAVRNTNMPKLHHHFLNSNLDQKQKKQYDKLEKGFDLTQSAFNAGVFTFKPSLMPTDSFRFLRNCLFQYGLLARFPEQPFTNLLVANNWHQLPYSYNTNLFASLSWLNLNPDLIDGHILHFNGNNKPWHENNPFHQEWQKNLSLPNIKNLNSSGRNPNRLKILYCKLGQKWAKIRYFHWKRFKKWYVRKFRRQC